jgi:choice-of-anchor B domain-containing protein
VAVSDGTVFVGEPDNTYNPGAVYLYRQQGGEWTRVGKISAEGAGPNDGFGSALAAEGDHVLVGASQRGGAAYLFREMGDGYRQVARLMPEDGGEEEGFGTTGVALGDDWVVVGAPGAASDGVEGAGAVYVFRRDGDTWAQTDRLTGSAADTSSSFGAAVAYEEGRLLVGAPGTGPNDEDSPAGSAYLFAHEDGAWSEIGMTEGSQDETTGFGAAVSLHDDRAFIGAPFQGGQTGKVGVYALTDGSNDSAWQPAGALHPFDGGQRSFFGIAIAHTDDETWVSALGAKQLSGRIYAFSESEDGDWSSSRTLATGANTRDLLGRSLAADGDVAAAGASGAGAATIFGRSGGDWIASAPIQGDPGGLPAYTGREYDCEDGQAAGRFGCQDVQLLSFTPIDDLGGEQGVNLNDIWGWTDPQTGTEYALVGRTNGMSFVDISDPQNPVYVGELPLTPGETQPNSWRDAKVYKNHMYVVADNAGEHGMQIFDLTRLRDYEMGGDPMQFEADKVYDRINSAHNVVINKETGYAYIVGAGGGGETCGGGLHMVNIQQPMQPEFAGCFADDRTGRRGTGYSHDAQCLIYSGPDTDHQGDEICFGSNETALSIADVTDKEKPVALAAAEYPRAAYTHQGWITDDHRYFYVNDELDELQNEEVDQTRTMIWDITDLDDPQLVKEYTWGPKSSDHNMYVKGERLYMSNYASGLRVHDISDPENPREVAYFDTSPAGDDDPAGFTGTWSNYPYFESGVVAVSSIGEGLFLLRPQPSERESL